MAKKKKKEEFDASLLGGYLPDAIPVTSMRVSKNTAVTALKAFNFALKMAREDRSRTQVAQKELDAWAEDYAEHHMSIGEAWLDYTGVPAAMSGGMAALGIQALLQSPQAWAGWRAGLYPSLTVAFGAEFIIGTMVAATILTIADPSHKYEGGTDELMRGVIHPTTSKEILMGLGSWGTVV